MCVSTTVIHQMFKGRLLFNEDVETLGLLERSDVALPQLAIRRHICVSAAFHPELESCSDE